MQYKERSAQAAVTSFWSSVIHTVMAGWAGQRWRAEETRRKRMNILKLVNCPSRSLYLSLLGLCIDQHHSNREIGTAMYFIITGFPDSANQSLPHTTEV